MHNRAALSAEITSLKAIVDGTDEDFSLQEKQERATHRHTKVRIEFLRN